MTFVLILARHKQNMAFRLVSEPYSNLINREKSYCIIDCPKRFYTVTCNYLMSLMLNKYSSAVFACLVSFVINDPV